MSLKWHLRQFNSIQKILFLLFISHNLFKQTLRLVLAKSVMTAIKTIQEEHPSIFTTPTTHHLITLTTTNAPGHAPPMHQPIHGPACPSSQTPIRPHLTYRHWHYMKLLLFNFTNNNFFNVGTFYNEINNI